MEFDVERMMRFNTEKEVFSILNLLLRKNISNSEIEKIISLESSVHEGSFPAKIINCRLKSGKTIILRIKYSDPEITKQLHRTGIDYEAKIYTTVLKNSNLSVAPFFGYVHESDSDALILGYVKNSKLIKHAQPEAFAYAAEWIANFHKNFEGMHYDFLKKYDQQYFQQWIDKVEKISGSTKNLEWFRKLSMCFSENIPLLLSGSKTIIHGEYYGKNILICDNVIYPLDWETCAIGPQEIDLAALLDGKDSQRIKLATDKYKATRYPNELPKDFEVKLVLSELYFKFRWIAEWVKTNNELKVWLSNKEYSNRLRKLSFGLGC